MSLPLFRRGREKLHHRSPLKKRRATNESLSNGRAAANGDGKPSARLAKKVKAAPSASRRLGTAAARRRAAKKRSNAQPAPATVNHWDGHLSDGPAADRRLVDRCLAGDGEAWRQLFGQQHHLLLASIRGMFGSAVCDTNQVEEIAARVWYKLLVREGRLLGQFDVEQGCRLSTFFGSIAHSTAVRMFRADKRRRRREAVASRPETHSSEESQHQLASRLGEFLRRLTPRERGFFLTVLAGGDSQNGHYTCTNDWQLRSRIQRKLSVFVKDED